MWKDMELGRLQGRYTVKNTIGAETYKWRTGRERLNKYRWCVRKCTLGKTCR